MYSSFQLAKKYLRFYITASNGKGHGIHSPFVYDFVKKVLNDNKRYLTYASVEKLRQQLLRDNSIVEIDDFGAGSATHKSRIRRVSDIVRSSASSPRQAQLLFRIIQYYAPDTIIELGSSLGISAVYMASAKTDADVITLEGATTIADIAERNFKELGLANIKLIRGDFENTLPELIQNANRSEGKKYAIYIDGNHRKEPTLKYFNMLVSLTNEDSFILLDDIHWSVEMEEAWREIKNDERVMLTIDLFFIGLVFFRRDFKVKQHFDIRV